MRSQDYEEKIVFAIHSFGSRLQRIFNRRNRDISATFRIGPHDDRVRVQLVRDDVSRALGFALKHALCPKQSKG
jgi:hypothetical protein